MDHPCEMHPQEGEARIRYWVDQVLHEELPLGNEFVILAPKGNDLKLRVDATDTRHVVGMEPSAIDQISTMDRPTAGLQHQLISVPPTAMDLGCWSESLRLLCE